MDAAQTHDVDAVEQLLPCRSAVSRGHERDVVPRRGEVPRVLPHSDVAAGGGGVVPVPGRQEKNAEPFRALVRSGQACGGPASGGYLCRGTAIPAGEASGRSPAALAATMAGAPLPASCADASSLRAPFCGLRLKVMMCPIIASPIFRPFQRLWLAPFESPTR